PDAMGLGLHFVEGEGPKFSSPIQTANDVAKLTIPEPETDLAYVMDTVRLVRHELNNRIPLIGFAGSPWTIASYMIEGGSSKTFSKIKKMLYAEPHILKRLLDILSQSIITYINAQIAAGVQVVMLFDTWGGILTGDDYREFSLQYMQHIIAHINRQANDQIVPIIVFTKNGGQWLTDIAHCGCDAVGLDWTIDIRTARQQIGDSVALQGNMDPCILYTNPKQIRKKAHDILARYGQGAGHIFNLGHGILPDVPPEHVAALIDAVHEYRHN
ncbi:MAG: uroporphyrinogen decarboxylase, partial [Gammaproteobacteria bacterium]|nr:uroporphyrinogen decarboxylase [Gammaproteobacteria bacterium]